MKSTLTFFSLKTKHRLCGLKTHIFVVKYSVAKLLRLGASMSIEEKFSGLIKTDDEAVIGS